MNLHNYEWYRRLRGGWYILDMLADKYSTRLYYDHVIENITDANCEHDRVYVVHYQGLFRKPRLRIRANV